MHVVFLDFHCFLRKVTGLEGNWIVMTHSIAKLSCLLPHINFCIVVTDQHAYVHLV